MIMSAAVNVVTMGNHATTILTALNNLITIKKKLNKKEDVKIARNYYR